MVSFFMSLLLLFIGYFTYGKFVDKVFAADDKIQTPAIRLKDNVDYVPMKWRKIFLVQFLNIAGLGPIFGAISGALWGPISFVWIVTGCIFAGAVHDYFTGVLSIRNNGASVSEIVGKYLGDSARIIMILFSTLLLILVGAVFITGPADLLNELTGINKSLFILVILIYYMAATVLPIDKIIGRVYPIFGVCFLFMAIGIAVAIIKCTYAIPEISFTNFHPNGTPIFPYLCITIACGAISGFHSTQSPIMARCVKRESEARKIFYGSMIIEGVIALIWAAAAMAFFGNSNDLQRAILTRGGASGVVNIICNTTMGKIGAAFSILGVIICPITSGDTAFRSARLTIADALKFNQKKLSSRFKIAIPLFVIGISLTFLDFEIIWRYFSWANQTLATIFLWSASSYMIKNKKNYFITMIPAIFMSVVTCSYILQAPEGLELPSLPCDIAGVLFAAILCVLFYKFCTVEEEKKTIYKFYNKNNTV